MKKKLARSLLFMGFAVSCLGVSQSMASGTTGSTAKADLRTADGKAAGTVSFVETPNGVLVTAELMNLPAGMHGFHIHEVGKCEGDFQSAGGHFAPDGKQHGFSNPEGFHAGDMPNVSIGSDGNGVFEYFNPRISLGEGKTSIDDSDGSAVIVHADRDSYLAEAGAGARIACGQIMFAE